MEVDYSQQPGLEPTGPTSPPRNYPEAVPKPEQPAEHAYAPGWNAVATDPAKPKRRICGLPLLTFGLIVALVILVIAAAVGGGVGGSIAVKNAKDSTRKEVLSSASAAAESQATPSPSPTPSGTSSANTYQTTQLAWGPVIKDPLPSTGCPQNNNTVYTSTNGPQKWRIYCGFDMPGYDLIQTNTPSLQLCIESCANWNTVFNNPSCKGVAFVPSYILGGAPSAGPSDCYLKTNGTEVLLVDKSTANIEFASVIVQ